jgi:hypothetical protein
MCTDLDLVAAPDLDPLINKEKFFTNLDFNCFATSV